jgi:hypothetical protein
MEREVTEKRKRKQTRLSVLFKEDNFQPPLPPPFPPSFLPVSPQIFTQTHSRSSLLSSTAVLPRIREEKSGKFDGKREEGDTTDFLPTLSFFGAVSVDSHSFRRSLPFLFLSSSRARSG